MSTAGPYEVDNQDRDEARRLGIELVERTMRDHCGDGNYHTTSLEEDMQQIPVTGGWRFTIKVEYACGPRPNAD
jgi:hypothetical protein